MKKIHDIFIDVFESGDLKKLVNLNRNSSREKKEYNIKFHISSKYKPKKIRKNILSELKVFFLGECFNFINLNRELIDKNKLLNKNIPEDYLIVGGSGALLDLTDEKNQIIFKESQIVFDFNKKFEDVTFAISKKINLFLDFNSIDIEIIDKNNSKELNLKFNFCIED